MAYGTSSIVLTLTGRTAEQSLALLIGNSGVWIYVVSAVPIVPIPFTITQTMIVQVIAPCGTTSQNVTLLVASGDTLLAACAVDVGSFRLACHLFHTPSAAIQTISMAPGASSFWLTLTKRTEGQVISVFYLGMWTPVISGTALLLPYTPWSTAPEATIQVTAPDGMSVGNITLVFASGDVTLASLTFDTYALDSAFIPTDYVYQVSIPGYLQFVGFTPVASGSQLQTLSFTVGLACGLVGSQPARPIVSGSHMVLWGEVAVGVTVLSILSVAQDNYTHATYFISFPSSDTDLSGLGIANSALLSPTYMPGLPLSTTFEYPLLSLQSSIGFAPTPRWRIAGGYFTGTLQVGLHSLNLAADGFATQELDLGISVQAGGLLSITTTGFATSLAGNPPVDANGQQSNLLFAPSLSYDGTHSAPIGQILGRIAPLFASPLTTPPPLAVRSTYFPVGKLFFQRVTAGRVMIVVNAPYANNMTGTLSYTALYIPPSMVRDVPATNAVCSAQTAPACFDFDTQLEVEAGGSVNIYVATSQYWYYNSTTATAADGTSNNVQMPFGRLLGRIAPPGTVGQNPVNTALPGNAYFYVGFYTQVQVTQTGRLTLAYDSPTNFGHSGSLTVGLVYLYVQASGGVRAVCVYGISVAHCGCVCVSGHRCLP